MAVSSGVLSCEEQGGPSFLFFTFVEECCRCVIVKKAESGMLLCIPAQGISMEHFSAAEEAGYVDLLGPFCELSAPVASGSSRASTRSVDVIIFDLDLAGADHVSTTLPDGVQAGEVKTFGLYRGNLVWPDRSNLLEAAQNFLATGGDRLQGYFTAEEFEAANPAPNGAGGGDTAALLQQLLSQSEVTQRTVSGMKDQFSKLGDLQKRLELLEQRGHPLGASAKAAASPQLFSVAATAAEPDRLAKLKLLAGRGPGRLGDLGATQQVQVVEEADGITEGVGLEDIDGEPLQQEPTSVLERVLLSQSAILEKLASSRSSQSDPLNLLGGSSAIEGEEIPKGSGVKGIAARQLLGESFRKHPVKVLNVFKERLVIARRKSSLAELEPRDLWLHFQDQAPLGSHKTLTYMAFMAAAMYEAMERGDMPRLSMLVALQAIFAEQASYDGGSLRMAHLLTMLEDPPFQQTEMHRTSKMEFAHSQLADPRWIAINLAYLKDLEGISEKNQKYAKPPVKPPDSVLDEPGPKKKAWKKRNGKKGGDAGEEEG